MILTVEPVSSGLQGEITPPGDKSISHRALIFACLADGRSEISGLLESEDTLATLKACEQLGAIVERLGAKIFITGTGGNLHRPANGFWKWEIPAPQCVYLPVSSPVKTLTAH